MYFEERLMKEVHACFSLTYLLAPLPIRANWPVAATMLNGRIGVRVTEWHSYQSMVWAHSRRALLFSINAWAHSPRAANHPKIVIMRALRIS